MARRKQVPPLRGPLPHAGSWGLPGPDIRRPASASLADYSGLQRMPIRPSEGSGTATVNSNGQAVVSVGPDGLNTWYVSYAAIATTTGAADQSTAAVVVGPIAAGIVPGGQSYAGGGDSIGLGSQVLRPGDYVTVMWAGGNPGDTATLTLYGDQDIPV